MTAPRAPLASSVTARAAGRQPRRPHLAAFAIYLALSLVLAGVPVLAHPATVHVGLGSDPSVMMWCMVWWPYAIAHRLNPFVSHVIWAPTGYNLAWSTSIPAVALALTPFTLAFGPVVSYNLAALLAPALSAWSAFALCRWMTGNFAAALIGALAYGFSPYEIGHILGGHLSFTINFVPSLCLLLFGWLFELSMTRCRFVLSFAALLVIQCFISCEILATMTAFGVIAWLSAYALSPAEKRGEFRATLYPLAAAFLLAGVMLSPFFYFAFANGAVPRQPLFPPSFFSTDLLSLVIPTGLLLLAPNWAQAFASQFSGNIEECEFYFDLPLLILMGCFFWSRRCEPSTRLLALMLLVIIIAALGPMLRVAGHSLAYVPWAAVYELPLLKQALPVRFSNFAFVVLALIVSISLSEANLRFSRILVVYGLAALLPNPSIFRRPGRYQQPAFFSEALYPKVLHRGENVVVFPYGVKGPSMMWQAESGMNFTMSGGYIGPIPEEFEQWPAVNAALFSLPLADSGRQLRSFLTAHQVEAIVAADGAGPLPASLGIKPIELGGVSVYQLPSRVLEAASDPGIERLEQAAAQEWIGDLLEAARRFLTTGRDLAGLNPVRLHELGLLPDSKWGRTLDLVLAGASHGTITALWAGPGPNRTVAVGMFASPAAVASLVACYGGETTGIFYPYPLRFSGVWPPDNRIDFVLLTMRLDFVQSIKRPALSACVLHSLHYGGGN